MIDSFNDLMKKLEKTGSQEDRISQLSDQLLAQGLATSKMEARQKAADMVKAERKSQTGFTEKKEVLTKYNDPRSDPNYYRKQNIEELRKRVMGGPRQIRIQSEFQTPGFERKNGSEGLPRTFMGRPATHVPTQTVREAPRPEPQPTQTIRDVPEPRQAPIVKAPEPVKAEPRPVTPQPTPVKAPEPVKTPEPQTAPKEETPKEEKKSKLPHVDLTSVFNFSKK